MATATELSALAPRGHVPQLRPGAGTSRPLSPPGAAALPEHARCDTAALFCTQNYLHSLYYGGSREDTHCMQERTHILLPILLFLPGAMKSNYVTHCAPSTYPHRSCPRSPHSQCPTVLAQSMHLPAQSALTAADADAPPSLDRDRHSTPPSPHPPAAACRGVAETLRPIYAYAQRVPRCTVVVPQQSVRISDAEFVTHQLYI